MKPAKVSRIIIACVVLHNLRLMWGNQQCIRNLRRGYQGRYNSGCIGWEKRDTIVANYFT
ncbi:hypothetical protein DPMN_165152 [Dreissena polymorpha]|uniref:Nuclease HARBI1 n=1 Tax=Dreissena polymorpha TaxID=45954 RepID=A0A9D4EX48_DREPO|nr:hypothetical protein DPMN_165152 [Dreissena polymorpha]